MERNCLHELKRKIFQSITGTCAKISGLRNLATGLYPKRLERLPRKDWRGASNQAPLFDIQVGLIVNVD